MALAQVSLDDKFALERGQVYLTGIQALVRLLILQRQRDRAAGLDTAGFVSGYRGSPLGALDQTLWQARPFLERARIHFQPGVNEDLAATAVWGSQQVNLFEGARHDGVFAMWYGKGPGVDRSGDVFKHANAAGTSRHGGVLAVAGDDHACKSSTLPHQSEFAFMDAMMPVLNPAGVQELLDMGLVGFALSRFSGCWVGFKTIAETVDSSASVRVDAERVRIVYPEGFELPAGGLHARWPDRPLDQELRLHRDKLYAAIAFARANSLDRVVVDAPRPRLGIVTTGKSYLDVCQALEDLGIDDSLASDIGLRVLKIGMSWPLDREVVRTFASGLEEILVVEEKRAVIENQLKEQLYDWREEIRPRIVGKFDESREWILPSTGELTPARIARVIAQRIRRFYSSARIMQRLAFLESKEAALARPRTTLERTPHFCSGCPHNTSTRVPQGSRAMGGIGCHYMATWMDRETHTFTQMGGEGVTWLGQAPFTDTAHVFQNLGDGTYFHSGHLAIRAAVAAHANITYKILYNDAVAMTGGQPIDGTLSVAQITRQLHAEGVVSITVVSDDPARHRGNDEFAPGVAFMHRDGLDALQRELRARRGVSVIVYDQTCAAEKRRRRKRGELVDPPERVFINEAVCEGCGDCGTKSNCLSVVPVETAFGRKRAIDQHACNKDFSCLNGFCPSFVSVRGAALRRRRASPHEPGVALPEPRLADLAEPYGIVITGVGGTGVITIGALLGMAAHLEGRGCSVLDMTGLAQKYGAVVSHVRIAERAEDIHAVRISAGRARLLLGCDLVVASGAEALAKCDPVRTRAVVNAARSMTAAFLRDPDVEFPATGMQRAIDESVYGGGVYVDAGRLAAALVGDSMGANLLLLGIAYQQGLLPVGAEAIERAIELNGVAVEANRQAFAWGRRYALDAPAVLAAARLDDERPEPPDTLDALVAHREAHLTEYQNAEHARRFRELVDRVRAVERARTPGRETLARAVASGYAKLLAYKDEYEVARLFAHADFRRALERRFEGDYRLEFHLAPPLLARRDPLTGAPRKRRFGAWMMPLMRLLAACRGLRGSALDPFGYTAERRLERRLITQYEETVARIVAALDFDNHRYAVALASLPEQVRGYGHVKHAAIEQMWRQRDDLLAAFEHPPEQVAA